MTGAGHAKTEEPILQERRGMVSIVRLNRPEVLNVLDRNALLLLAETLQAEAVNGGVRGVVLAGNEQAFCAGEDLREARRRTGEGLQELFPALHGITRVLLDMPKPAIAAIDGYALGGGLEITLACDLRVASERARFGAPEGRLGMTISNASSVLLPALIGAGRAKEMVLTGTLYDAAWALQSGLVNRVVPGDPAEEAIRWVEELTTMAPGSLEAGKRLLNSALREAAEAAMDREEQALRDLARTSDAREGLAAFLERREPRFAGR